ncbi:acyl-CoA thioesterase [Tropicimonas isoalkanivorans]|uniref:Acyl-CoA thioester hydrolase n=1 Tax=Tropicimonas isoalkanivorans TaxID=441112 RepID=A0A1I1HSM1_9RHOB|nr:thioesterase family protein [Tropicimonas isoalkanivorans]SFC26805.1 acyl-CoA thioester hydrolase [Tropicimonas isoalkanivorans]
MTQLAALTDGALSVTERLVEIEPGDIYGTHVNNARYFEYINRTFRDWYHALGFAPGHGRTAGPMMGRIEYDFRAEMHYPGRVLCQLAVTRIGRASLTHRIALLDPDRPDPERPKGTLVGEGLAINVWFSRSTGRAEPWPDEMRRLCAPAG